MPVRVLESAVRIRTFSSRLSERVVSFVDKMGALLERKVRLTVDIVLERHVEEVIAAREAARRWRKIAAGRITWRGIGRLGSLLGRS